MKDLNLEQVNRMFDKVFPADLAQKVRQNCAELEAREDVLIEKLRSECSQAIGLLSDVIQRPTIARVDLTQAIVHLHAALKSAREMDPEPRSEK